MKKLLLLLFALSSLVACKKETDLTPNPTKPAALAEKFAGTYTLSSFRLVDTDSEVNLDLPTLPVTNAGQTLSGKVTLTKKTDTTLDLDFLLKVPDSDDFEFDIKGLEARQVGSEYGLFMDGTRVADVEGSIIIFNYSETTTRGRSEMTFNAKR